MSLDLVAWAQKWKIELSVLPKLMENGFDVPEVVVEVSVSQLREMSLDLEPGDIAKFEKGINELKQLLLAQDSHHGDNNQKSQTQSQQQSQEKSQPQTLRRQQRCKNCHNVVESGKTHNQYTCTIPKCQEFATCPTASEDFHHSEITQAKRKLKEELKKEKEKEKEQRT